MTEYDREIAIEKKERSPWAFAIWTGLISAILTAIFLQPLLNILSETVYSSANTIFRSYIDQAYESAAVPMQERFASLVLMSMVSAQITILAMFAVFCISVIKNKSPLLLKGRDRKSVILTYPKILIFISVSAIAGAILLVILPLWVAQQANAQFEQYITILSPHYSEIEVKTMRAKWASMKSQSDFRKILEEFFDKAKTLNLKLPRSDRD